MKIRSMFKNRATPGYEVKSKADAPTEVYIYDEIGFFGVDAETFVKDFKQISGDVIVRINSPGGSVFDGMAIYNAIRDHKAATTTIIDGLAASAASYIALAGDKVVMAEGAFLMIHDPYSLVIGTSDDMRKEANLLDKVRDQIGSLYARKSGKDLAEITQMMADETWMTGKEAVDLGFADETMEQEPAANLFDLSVFNNVPERLFKTSDGDTPTRKDIEQALRHAGMSRQQAKAFYSGGKSALEPIDEDGTWAAAKCLELEMKGL
jgi:ATP-dependent Clp protease, protease subunit